MSNVLIIQDLSRVIFKLPTIFMFLIYFVIKEISENHRWFKNAFSPFIFIFIGDQQQNN